MRRDFRLRVHDPGTTTPTNGTVAFVLSDLVEIPAYGDLLVRPADGRADLGRWAFYVLDTGGVLTSNLANSTSGRAHLIGRVVEYQESRDGGAWTTELTARLTAVSLDSDRPNVYAVTLESERWVERNARVFDVADTAWLWPAGLRYAWREALPSERFGDARILSTSSGRTRIEVRSDHPLSSRVVEWIRRDVVSDAVSDRTDGKGNFQHLRARINDVDYPVLSFSGLRTSQWTESLLAYAPPAATTFTLWIAGTLPSASSYRLRLWAPTAPPSDTLPLHLGTFDFLSGSSGHRYGFPNPWDLVEALYTEAGVRFDPAALNKLKASTDYPSCGWRITTPSTTLASFLEEQIYAPFCVIPFLDAQGRVSPRSIRLPAAEDFDPSAAFVFDADNVATVPTWDHSATEVVNQVVVETRDYRRVAHTEHAPVRPVSDDFAADFLEEVEVDYGPVDYDTETTGVGIRSKVYRAHGLTHGWFRTFSTVEETVDYLVTETFDRFGDGPQWSSFRSLRTPQDGSGRTPESRQPGELVILDLDTWPNLATGQRGGARVVQIMSRRPTADGIEWQVLDAGPALQPLAAPTVAIAPASGDNYTAVTVTISGVPSGARATLEIGIGSGSTYDRQIPDLPNGTHTVRLLPSGSTIRARARSTAPNRIRSLPSSVASTTTATLPAPTSLTATVEDALVHLTWTPASGVESYPLMPAYRVGSGAWVDALATPLPPGSSAYTFGPLATSTAHTVGIRHVDAYGGRGALASTAATTGATARTLAVPQRPQIVQGRGANAVDLPPEHLIIGYGIHVRFVPTELHAETVLEVATDPGFSVVERTARVSPGGIDAYVHTESLDDTPRYLRLRHERAGYTSSDWSAVVTSRPTGLLAVPGDDRFAGGIAELRQVDGDKLELFVQSGGDPNTTTAYYDWALNPSPEEWPDVDETSYELGPLPERETLHDGASPPVDASFSVGDVVLVRVRFRGPAGFGQDVLFRHEYTAPSTPLVSLDSVSYTYGPEHPTDPLARRPRLITAVLRVPIETRSYSYDFRSNYSASSSVETGGDDVSLLTPLLSVTHVKSTPVIVMPGPLHIEHWDITLYDDTGGAGGAGSVLATFRILDDIPFSYIPPRAVQSLWRTDGSDTLNEDLGLRLGSDGLGDGVFRAEGTAIVLRDSADASSVSGSWTPDYADGACQYASMAGDTELQMPTNWGLARPMNLRITTNGHALTFQSSRFYAAGGALPDLDGTVFLSIVQVTTNYVVVAALADLGAL